MAKNVFTRHRDEAPASRELDRGPAAILSPEHRILCALLLDVSYSMHQSGALGVVARALPEFREALMKHEATTRRLSWAIVTYAETAKLVQPYGPLAAWEPATTLKPGSGTAMASGILQMLHHQEEHLKDLGSQAISHQHAFCFHVSDGYPNIDPPERFDEAARLIAETEKNHFTFYSVAVESADINMLRRLTPKRTPLKLAEIGDFYRFFRWLEVSMTRMSESQLGTAVDFPNPLKTEPKAGGREQAEGEGEDKNPLGWGTVPA